jgi:hypothetical protein
MSTAHWQARRLPIPAAWPARSNPAVHPWAIISAGLAPILLTGAYLMAGLLQPASYSPVRTTISVMAGQAGTDRWVMTGGIVLVAGCYLVTAAGLTGVRASARALLALAGLAGIGIAVALRRTRHPRPGLAIGGSGGVKDGPTARASARGRRLLGDSALSAPARKFVGGDVLACSSRVGRATPRVLGGVRGGPVPARGPLGAGRIACSRRSAG